MRSKNGILGDTALDILVDVGSHPRTTIAETADRVCITYHAVLYHIGHALRHRVRKIYIGRLVRLDIEVGQ